MKRRSFLKASAQLGALLAFPALALPAAAQSYPDKLVRVVVPYPPGGPLDMLARALAQQLQVQTGRSFIVENKPGGGGNIGSDFVATAPADGYTLLLSGSNITIAPALYKATTRFDPVTSFTHIGRLVTMPTAIAVRPDSPHKTLQDLVAAARAKPGDLTYGTPGTGSPSQIAMELLKRAARMDVRIVPYKGSVNAVTDLLAGQIDMVPSVVSGVAGHVKAGRLRALAVTSQQRDPMLPDVPAVAESYPGFEVVTWLGISAPKGLPPDVTAVLQQQLVRALADPALAASLRSAGMNPAWLDSAQLAALVATETEQYTKVIREANLTPE